MPIISVVASNAGLVLASVPVLVVAAVVLVHIETRFTKAMGLIVLCGAVLAMVLFIAAIPYVTGG